MCSANKTSLGKKLLDVKLELNFVCKVSFLSLKVEYHVRSFVILICIQLCPHSNYVRSYPDLTVRPKAAEQLMADVLIGCQSHADVLSTLLQ